MFRDSTDKLERHEYRERVLGDHLKKALSALDKRQRTLETNMDTVAVTLGKLDTRLATIEGKLDHQVTTSLHFNSRQTNLHLQNAKLVVERYKPGNC